MTQAPQTIEIDARGKILGRLASEVASILRGKRRVDFAPNRVAPVKVVIRNSAHITVTGTKLQNKLYYTHSGHLGSLRSETLSTRLQKSPERTILEAVRGMLADTRLRSKMLKNIVFIKENHAG